MNRTRAAVRLLILTLATAGVLGPATPVHASTTAASPATAAAPVVAAPVVTATRVPVTVDSAETDRLSLKLVEVTPVAVGPDDPLVVRGTVRNLGSTTLTRAQVLLRLGTRTLADRTEINDWLAEGSLTDVGQALPGDVTLGPIPAGETVPFTLTVPPGQTGLYPGSEFGPRAIAIEVNRDQEQLAVLRSTVVWAPTEVPTTRLSIMVPITASTASTHAGEATLEAADDVLPGGRLNRILTATQDPDIAWAIDPSILTAAERLIADGIDSDPDDAVLVPPTSNDPTADGSSSGSTTNSPAPSAQPTEITDDEAITGAQEWLNQFRGQATDREVFGLPYADPDLTAVLRTRRGAPLLRSSDALGLAATESALGGPLDTTVAWPANGRISAAATRTLARTGRTAVVLAGRSQPPSIESSITPNGVSAVRSSAPEMTGLLYDEELSNLIGGTSGGSAGATQTFLAHLAAITKEDPNTTRHLLAVTPRTWNPAPASIRTMMNAINAAPWIELGAVADLRTADRPDRGTPIYGKRALDRELPRGGISAALVLNQGLTTFAPALVDPAPVQPRQERIASLLSVAWREDRESLVPARIAVAADVNELVEGVQLRIGADPKLFTADQAQIQIFVDNDTDHAVDVVVRLRPQSGQLAFENTAQVRAKARSLTPVVISTRALASADVVVESKLLTVDGVALGPGKEFVVRVRLEWENWGLIGVGSLLGLLLVIGLLRGVRRNRTRVRVPIEAVPDPDEQATERAADHGLGAGSRNGSPGSGAPHGSGALQSSDAPQGSGTPQQQTVSAMAGPASLSSTSSVPAGVSASPSASLPTAAISMPGPMPVPGPVRGVEYQPDRAPRSASGGTGDHPGTGSEPDPKVPSGRPPMKGPRSHRPPGAQP